MTRTPCKILLALTLFSASCVALGDDGSRKRMPLVAVINAQLVGLQPNDTERCLDPLLSFRIDVAGSAQTTLGRAQFTQTHCENDQHTIFGTATISLVFDDGTKLTATCQGQILATPTTGLDSTLVVTGEYRDTGGTGVLSTAHGTGAYVGTVNLSTYTVTLALTGKL